MIIRCQACGAALETDQSEGVVACNYCNAANHLRKEKPKQRHAPVPAGGTPAAYGLPVRRSKLGWLVPFILFGLVGGSVWFFQFGPGWKLIREWYSPGCLVDADGDDTLDVAGWSGSPTNMRNLTVVSGRTGDIVWTADEDFSDDATVVCLPPGRVAVARPDFVLDMRDARSGAPVGTVALPDELRTIGLGDECAGLETADGSKVGVSLADASTKECWPAKQFPIGYSGCIAGPGGPYPPVPQDGIHFSAHAREKGSALVSVTATRDGQRLWETPLNLLSASHQAIPLIVTPQMVVLWGVRPGEDDYGVIVGIEPESGRVRYEVRQDSSWSGNLTSYLYNGRLVVAAWGAGLHAYDPATGGRVWHMGGR